MLTTIKTQSLGGFMARKRKMHWKGVPYISYAEYRELVKGVEDRPKKRTVRVQFPNGYIRHVKV